MCGEAGFAVYWGSYHWAGFLRLPSTSGAGAPWAIGVDLGRVHRKQKQPVGEHSTGVERQRRMPGIGRS